MNETIKTVENKLESIASELGYELVELQGLTLGGRTVVRGFIHKAACLQRFTGRA